MSHVTCHSQVTCHILRKLKILAWLAALKIQILASFLKLGQNLRMMSEKIHFSRTSCEDFVLASKMKPKFEFLTPPYFCDTCFQVPLVASFWWYFWKFWKNHFLLHFYTFLKIIDFNLFFVSSSVIFCSTWLPSISFRSLIPEQ